MHTSLWLSVRSESALCVKTKLLCMGLMFYGGCIVCEIMLGIVLCRHDGHQYSPNPTMDGGGFLPAVF